MNPQITADALRLRALTPDDAEAYVALRRVVTALEPVAMALSLEEELSRPLATARAQLGYPAPSAAFGAFVGERLAGCAAVHWPSPFPSARHKALLWGVFVAPDARRRGVARAVVAHALEHAFACGARRVNLVAYGAPEAAVRLYEALGFEPFGVEPEALRLDGRFHDALHMSRRDPRA